MTEGFMGLPVVPAGGEDSAASESSSEAPASTPTPEQIALLRHFSIVSVFEAKRVGVKVKDCCRLVDLGLLSETGTPRRYRLTHQGYLASRITSTATAADFAA